MSTSEERTGELIQAFRDSSTELEGEIFQSLSLEEKLQHLLESNTAKIRGELLRTMDAEDLKLKDDENEGTIKRLAKKIVLDCDAASLDFLLTAEPELGKTYLGDPNNYMPVLIGDVIGLGIAGYDEIFDFPAALACIQVMRKHNVDFRHARSDYGGSIYHLLEPVHAAVGMDEKPLSSEQQIQFAIAFRTLRDAGDITSGFGDFELPKVMRNPPAQTTHGSSAAQINNGSYEDILRLAQALAGTSLNGIQLPQLDESLAGPPSTELALPEQQEGTAIGNVIERIPRKRKKRYGVGEMCQLLVEGNREAEAIFHGETDIDTISISPEAGSIQGQYYRVSQGQLTGEQFDLLPDS